MGSPNAQPDAHAYLSVPFRDNATVRALGARWDAVRRQWYVPRGMDIVPFLPWIRGAAGLNLSKKVRKVLKQGTRRGLL